MKPIDYIIIAVIVLIVAAIAVYIIRKKLKGEKVGCNCGCSSCPHGSTCGGNAAAETDETDDADKTENASETCTCEKCGAAHADKDHGEQEHDETV